MTPLHQVKHILFPTDFSPASELAMGCAVSLARQTGSRLHFVYVMDPMVQGILGDVNGGGTRRVFGTVVEHAQKRLTRLEGRAAAQGLEASSQLLIGDTVQQIINVAQGLEAPLITIATHGHSGYEKLVFGSTCDKLLRLSPVPVLTVKHPECDLLAADTPAEGRSILCPCDFSPFSYAAFPVAAYLAHKLSARLILAHVEEPRYEFPEFLPELAMSCPSISQTRPFLERVGAGRLLEDVQVEDVLLNGTPHRELTRYINEQGVGLVVMATHGRGGVAGVLFGSVAEKMVRSAPCPVLTVRPSSEQPELAAASERLVSKAV